MADDIGGVWRTIGGRRVFIKDGQDLKQAMKESGKFYNKKLKEEDKLVATAKEIRQRLKDLESDKYEDGTYNLKNKKSISFNDGFQATFQQLNDNYSDKEFGELVKEYQTKTDGKAYAGKFGGSPEISFHFKDEKDAIEVCKKFNQVSYWDWGKAKNDPTYTGTPNPYYKKGKGNDYD